MLRTPNGIRKPLPYLLGWNAANDLIGSNFLRDDRAGRDDRTLSDAYAGIDDRTKADPHVIADHSPLDTRATPRRS